MRRIKTLRKQCDLFSQGPKHISWQKLDKASGEKIELLLAQLLLSLLCQKTKNRKECHHAIEN
jgi:hypothetical protein